MNKYKNNIGAKKVSKNEEKKDKQNNKEENNKEQEENKQKNREEQQEEKENQERQEEDIAKEDEELELSETEKELKAELDNTKDKLKEVIKENEELNDKFTRLAAEFKNYKKRVRKEEKHRLKYEGTTILKELLPIFDDIDRAVKHQEEEEKNNKGGSTDQGGLKMIYKKLHKVLNDLGVEKYDSVGEEFDPDLHHAIMTKDDEEHDADIVLEEIEKGYKYKDRVLRYAKVIVSK